MTDIDKRIAVEVMNYPVGLIPGKDHGPGIYSTAGGSVIQGPEQAIRKARARKWGTALNSGENERVVKLRVIRLDVTCHLWYNGYSFIDRINHETSEM